MGTGEFVAAVQSKDDGRSKEIAPMILVPGNQYSFPGSTLFHSAQSFCTAWKKSGSSMEILRAMASAGYPWMYVEGCSKDQGLP
jgi:hypothetical protein